MQHGLYGNQTYWLAGLDATNLTALENFGLLFSIQVVGVLAVTVMVKSGFGLMVTIFEAIQFPPFEPVTV